MQLNSSGANVSALQCFLIGKGYTAVPENGAYNSATVTAVKEYQKLVGLSQTGNTDAAFYPKIISNVSQGSVNKSAKAAQYLLNKFGAGLVVDGNFGPASNTATKNFQTKMGITSDGIIGPTSWQYLFGYSAYPSTQPTTSTLTLTGSMTIPNPMYVGTPIAVKGTVSSNYTLTKVTGSIGGSSFSSSVNPNAMSYNMSGMDSALMFSKLSTGSYNYTVSATDSSGTTKQWVVATFTVSTPPPDPSYNFGWRWVFAATNQNTISSGYKLSTRSPLHPAIDLSWGGILGTPIYSPCAGTVVRVEPYNTTGWGNMVVLESSNLDPTTKKKIRITFAHMRDLPSVSNGSSVFAGTLLGYVGSTGTSTGPHLHLAMFNDGSLAETVNNSINPQRFFAMTFIGDVSSIRP